MNLGFALKGPGTVRLGGYLASALRWSATLAMGICSSLQSAGAATINASTPSRADVGTAVALAKDGDIVNVPAGAATWTSTLEINKNIQLIGAGEGKTVITENLSRSGSPPILSVSLTHESPASAQYSFRLSNFTFNSVSTSSYLATDHAFITITGKAPYVASPTATNPAPSVLGCVGKVRVDHITFDHMHGICIIPDSVLGVMDHVTQLGVASSTFKGVYPVKVYHQNWTPALRSDPGHVGEPMTTLAQWGFGSWADDAYYGSDKFWFIEDSTFRDNPNVCDDEGGGRTVWRHNTLINSGGFAGHGMEAGKRTGHRASEFYNNYIDFVTDDVFPDSVRSGSCLWFNNKLAHCTNGLKFYTFRYTRYENAWGGGNGQSRYDDNVTTGGPNNDGVLYSGTVTGGIVSSNGFPIAAFQDAHQANFNNITPGDGSYYVAQNLDDPANANPSSFDPGWRYHQSGIVRVNGNTLNLLYEGTTIASSSPLRPYSALWHVGDRYQIRKVRAIYGQPGQGKGRLVTATPTSNIAFAYDSYFFPATSGAKATYPNAGFPLEPCYQWNNTDSAHGLLKFNPNGNLSLLPRRDYFDLPERAISTQNVGYPSQPYTRATASYPGIGPSGSVPYTPYTYPHPLTQMALSPPTGLQIVP